VKNNGQHRAVGSSLGSIAGGKRKRERGWTALVGGDLVQFSDEEVFALVYV